MGPAGRVTAVTFSKDGRYAAFGTWDGTVEIWECLWDYEFPSVVDWDEQARPLLNAFLRLHAPSRKLLGLARKPRWSEEDERMLLEEVANRGLGWIRPEGLRKKLKEMAAHWSAKWFERVLSEAPIVIEQKPRALPGPREVVVVCPRCGNRYNWGPEYWCRKSRCLNPHCESEFEVLAQKLRGSMDIAYLLQQLQITEERPIGDRPNTLMNCASAEVWVQDKISRRFDVSWSTDCIYGRFIDRYADTSFWLRRVGQNEYGECTASQLSD